MTEGPATGAPLSSGDRILERAREVVRIESEAVAALVDRIGPAFLDAVHLILSARGRVVVTGIGKSGLVARKLAATFSSTGTPAVFLHPAEGLHGDVGMLVPGDVVLAVSKSGESEEIVRMLPAVKRLEVPVVALTADPTSTLARRADLVLDAAVPAEACPHDLAPTASSTAAMALGDALAIALLEERAFSPEDFARLHPGGGLGRRLLWRVRDVMVTGDEAPSVTAADDLGKATHEIAHRRGTVPVVDGERRVVGILTAGDLMRFADGRPDFLRCAVREAMNPRPRTAAPDEMAAEVLSRMERDGIMAMPVIDAGGSLLGVVHLHDLLRAGLA